MTKPKWVSPDWMPEGEVPADALTDLRATANELSVWRVDPDRSNLEVVLTAHAASRDELAKIDYAVFDDVILSEIPIKYVKSKGETPHPMANAEMHHDLIELTVRKVASLAHGMMALERGRLPEKQVKRLLQDALQSGILDRAQIKPKLLVELESTD